MNVLLDTNVLGRLAEPGHLQHKTALDATAALGLRSEVLCVVPQVLYEFWVVATRPLAVNGLGLFVSETVKELARIKALFSFFADMPAVYLEWERLVAFHIVAGKDAHDARLVAATYVHGLTHLLTFNGVDFARYPGINVLDPAMIAAPHSSRP
jgi:predicted nucleic acid-binding protein